MTKNLQVKLGARRFPLLKQQAIRDGPELGPKDKTRKYIGYILFNKGFVEDFISELDKIHDINIQLERSLPMIYNPAPWKNYYFGGYYLK